MTLILPTPIVNFAPQLLYVYSLPCFIQRQVNILLFPGQLDESSTDRLMIQDAVNALTGVLTRYARQMNSPVLHGLPVVAFDLFILFFNTEQNADLDRRKEFPSYSWAG